MTGSSRRRSSPGPLPDPEGVHLVNEVGPDPQVGDLVRVGNRVVGRRLADGTERLVVQDLVSGPLQKIRGFLLPARPGPGVLPGVPPRPPGPGALRILPDE